MIPLPWFLDLMLPAFLTLTSFIGALTVSESLSVMWRERRAYPFLHPLTQYRLMMLCIGVTLVVGAGPDAFVHLLKHEISPQNLYYLRLADLYFDTITWVPTLLFSSILLLNRWRIRNALAVGALERNHQLVWALVIPTSAEAINGTDKIGSPYLELRKTAPTDWRAWKRRTFGIVGLALLATYAARAPELAFG